MSNPTPTNWPAAWAAMRELDGGAWDTEREWLDALWCAEYVAAFVAFALTRNWTRENAEEWAYGIAYEALNAACGFDLYPAEAARADVVECERDAANA